MGRAFVQRLEISLGSVFGDASGHSCMKKYLLKGQTTGRQTTAMLEVTRVAHRGVTARLTESLMLEKSSKIAKSNL